MKETIAEDKPVITLEVGDFDLADVPSSNELTRFLTEMGYRPYEIVKGDLVPHVLKERYSPTNLVFIFAE
jgi:hypothetical protein